MISINDVISSTAAAISSSSAISSWMTANFPNETLSIFVGDDPVDPPGENQAPYIIIAPSPQAYDMGEDAQARRPVFDVDFGILKASKTVAAGVTTCDGLALSDALGNLILAAIIAKFTSGRVESAAYALTPIHPLYEGGMTITLNFEGGMGEPSQP